MQDWAKILGQKGWLAFVWPKDLGCPGGSAVQKHLFEEECALQRTGRRLPLLDGECQVNEVFFDNVEVPADQLISEEHKGWTYAKHVLAHEPTNIADLNRSQRELERLKRIAQRGLVLEPLAQQERSARYRLEVCKEKATETQTGHALTALKSVAPAGDQADAFIVPAQLDGPIALLLVERSAAGVATRGYRTQHGSRAAEAASRTCSGSWSARWAITPACNWGKRCALSASSRYSCMAASA